MAFISGVIEGFYGTPWKNSERRNLFARLKNIGLNTYMYAPKDDKKHRKHWRSSYTEQESRIIKNLIDTSEAHGIDFVYAISPGLDIVFTSTNDLKLLKEKLQQVHSFGCRSFAILFDDIDPELCLADKTEYSTSADAQTAITNKLYEWFSDLNTILFCPTEYCDTRAVPNIVSSEYLKTLGEKLHESIKILWTGPKVVSNVIQAKSLENLNKVLQRKVVIWDNIHANDYDSRRMFLGPFQGRELEIYNHTSGVLTNPNCDYHSNFIAIESFAIWKEKAFKYCTAPAGDGKKEIYDPEETLLKLCEKWMILLKEEQPFSFFHRSKNTNDLELNSLVDDEEKHKNGIEQNINTTSSSDDEGEKEECQKTTKKKKTFGVEDLVLLCHFFYLPYEEGEKAREMISQFKWLKENVIDHKKHPIKEKIDRWYEKQIQFLQLCDEVSSMCESFTRIKNKSIVQQLHPFVVDVRETVNLLKKFAKHLGSKERQNGESFVPEDPEAWYFHGGVLGKMERLLPTSNEEFHNESRTRNASFTRIIRPYLNKISSIPTSQQGDGEQIISKSVGVSKLCKDLHPMVPKENSEIPFDSSVGAFLNDESCHSFLLEIDDVICAIVAGCNSAEKFYEKYAEEYLPKIRLQYGAIPPTNTSASVPAKWINRLQDPPFVPSAEIMKQYPAILTLEFTPEYAENIPKLLKCIMGYLKCNAVHMVKYEMKKRDIEHYKGLGFDVLFHDGTSTEIHVLGYKV